MDSNRRHQLSENSLAKWFKKQYDEWIAPSGSLLGTIVLVVLLVVCSILFFQRYIAWGRSAAWNNLQAALASENPMDELNVLAETAKEPVRTQARLSLAQLLFGEGCSLAVTDKSKALEQLEKAVEHFRYLENATAVSVRQQAMFGLAQSLETLAAVRSGSDLAEAEKMYQKIATQWPDDFCGKRSAKQLAFVTLPSTKKFLELAAAKVVELPKAEDFKVDIDTKDAFIDGPQSFDPAKALGDDSGDDAAAAEQAGAVDTAETPAVENAEPQPETSLPETPSADAEPATTSAEGEAEEER